MTSPSIHPADEVLPLAQLAVLGLQHVLVMYAGAIAVPLIVGRALKLPPEQVALLISADLFCCGIATLVQSWGVTQWFGARLPVIMGVTFAAVGPMVAMAGPGGAEGARAIFGAVIGAGIVGMLIAPVIGRLIRFFPPVVTGTIIAVIGISLMRVGVGWALGGPAHLARLPGPGPQPINPAYGALDHLAIAAFVLAVILLVARHARGFMANVAVLIGIGAGCAVAAALGEMDFRPVAQAGWFALVTPFAFGLPTFDPVLIATMSLVMVVVMIESVGMFLALSELTGRTLSRTALSAGLRTNGLGTLIGGIFNTFPHTSFSQNVGLVGLTGVRSRFVCVAAGLILIVLGLLPKMAALVESVPTFVLGGAGLVMFGMVAATGIRILGSVDYRTQRHNLHIVAVSLGFGLLPLVAPQWMQHMHPQLQPLLESGILLAALSAVALNLYFNGAKAGAATADAPRASAGGQAPASQARV